MKQTELIIFVVIMVLNAGFAIVKKYKERQAAKAAAALERAITSNAPPARATPAARTTPAMRATTAARASTASTRAGGATSIDSRGSMRREIRDTELQAAAARRRQAEARLFEQQVAAEKARIAAQQRQTPPVIQPAAMQVLQAALARSKSAVPSAIAASRITGNSIGSPRVVEPVRAKLLIGDRAGLRRALILREVLGPPRCMAPYGGTQ
ncbi:MAG: hypothetical protein DWH71_03200 [Planctomycetota bacterium]|nr:MAG: hypothetical protein DWH71_03200 [Planctomycetota bacterium]